MTIIGRFDRLLHHAFGRLEYGRASGLHTRRDCRMRFDKPEFQWHVMHGSTSSIRFRPGAAIRTLREAVIIAAYLVPTLLSTQVSIAATVHELDGLAEPRVGTFMDARTPAAQEFERGGDRVGPAHSNTFDAAHSSDYAGGLIVPIHGIAFTFDEAIAQSYRTDSASNAVTDADNLPAIGDSRDFSHPARNAGRTGRNVPDQTKSVPESAAASSRLLEANEWDMRDFRPPEWVETLRNMTRIEVRNEGNSVTPQSGSVDTGSWIKDSIRLLMFVQSEFQAIDPWVFALLGIVCIPFVLVGFARSMRHRRAPARPTRTRKRIVSRPIMRLRRRRKRTGSPGFRTQVRS